MAGTAWTDSGGSGTNGRNGICCQAIPWKWFFSSTCGNVQTAEGFHASCPKRGYGSRQSESERVRCPQLLFQAARASFKRSLKQLENLFSKGSLIRFL